MNQEAIRNKVRSFAITALLGCTIVVAAAATLYVLRTTQLLKTFL